MEEYADILRGIKHAPYYEGDYISHSTGRPGYRAYFQVGSKWYWYSVSNTTDAVTPSAVADALMNGLRRRSGSYKANGFEATVKFDGHSYMVNMGSSKPNIKK